MEHGLVVHWGGDADRPCGRSCRRTERRVVWGDFARSFYAAILVFHNLGTSTVLTYCGTAAIVQITCDNDSTFTHQCWLRREEENVENNNVVS